METVGRTGPTIAPEDAALVPPLREGDRMTREEFERRYEAMPDLKKAELIEGVVHMPSPVTYRRHGRPHFHVNTWLGVYEAGTPGVSGADNASLRLELDSEPQPDTFLMILPTHGGQAHIDADDYVAGAPELIVEVAASSASEDLGKKRTAYARAGVREYLVWRVLDRALDWFIFHEGREERLLPGEDGISRSQVFPGLWLDSAALIEGNLARVLQVLQEGLASPEHAAFRARLAEDAARGSASSP